MEVMLDKKEIPAILLEFKIGCNVVETPHNINNTSCSGTANEDTVHWWFKTFCKRNRSLEDEECSGPPSMKAIIKADPPTTTGEIAQELRVDHLWSFGA